MKALLGTKAGLGPESGAKDNCGFPAQWACKEIHPCARVASPTRRSSTTPGLKQNRRVQRLAMSRRHGDHQAKYVAALYGFQSFDDELRVRRCIIRRKHQRGVIAQTHLCKVGLCKRLDFFRGQVADRRTSGGHQENLSELRGHERKVVRVQGLPIGHPRRRRTRPFRRVRFAF